MLISSIKSRYLKSELHHISQGDIFRDARFVIADNTGEKVVVREVVYSYLIIISQDCDLVNCNKNSIDPEKKLNNQFLPNVLALPAFPAETLRDGKHLKELYDIVQDRITSEKYGVIRKNKDPRYQFLLGNPDLLVPDLAIDFKYYVSFPYIMFEENYKVNYLATLNELFREDLSHRFCSYISRIGLPEL